jgi:hypothetical protein
MDTMNFGNELINHFLKDTGRTSFGEWYDEEVCTIDGLATFINKFAASRLPRSYRESLWHYLLYPLLGLGFGIHYIFKYTLNAFRYFSKVLNK